MSDEYSYREELKTLIVTLAHKVADDPEIPTWKVANKCEWLAGGKRQFERALDEQRQEMSDIAPARSES